MAGWTTREAIAAIRRAVDLGITCFDTAPAYGLGRAEEILAEALGPRRKDVVVVTKCGIPFVPEERRFGRNATYDHIIESAEESLRRLHTDYLDLLLIHWPDEGTPAEETMRALNELHRSGKARYIGVSNFSPEQMADCLRHGPLHAEQVGYNLFDRRREGETFAFCREHGIGIMAYGPLAHGLLTGQFSEETTFGEQDWRAGGKAFGLPIFERENLIRNVRVVEQLKGFAAERGYTVAQLALAWVLRRPEVSVALVGRAPPPRSRRRCRRLSGAWTRPTWRRSRGSCRARPATGRAGHFVGPHLLGARALGGLPARYSPHNRHRRPIQS